MAGGAGGAGGVCGEHWRFDGAMDQQSLGLDAASRGESAAGSARIDAAAIDRIFSPAELGGGDFLHSDVSLARREGEVSPGWVGRTFDGEVPQHGEAGGCGKGIDVN